MQACGERVAQGLALLAKACLGELKKSFQHGNGNERFRIDFDDQHGRVHAGGGEEGRGGDPGGDARLAVDLHAERQQAQIAWFGADAFRDLLLDGQYDAARFAFAFEQVADDGRGDVVRDVGHDQVLGPVDDIGRGQVEDVGVDQAHVGMRLEHGLQWRDQLQVQFDGDDLFGGDGQVAGQASQAGTNLQHGIVGLDPGSAGDAFEGFGVFEEILAEAFIGMQAVAFEQGKCVQRGDLGEVHWQFIWP